MIKRTIEISAEPAHLTVRDGQLLILRKDPAEAARRLPAHPPNLAASIPCEDLGMIMVDQRETTFSLAALAAFAEHGTAFCICAGDHLPSGLLLPLSDRHETVWRIKDQIAIRKPTKKRLWRQIVRAKIRAQARNLPESSPAFRRLRAMHAEVRSGDPTNVEAQAAKLYWSRWLGEGVPFKRIADPALDGPPPNNLLNYGYAILRAAVARAIVSAGLLPALGIHHDSRSNPFCLADDLVEPLRPIVDRRVRDLYLAGSDALNRDTKQSLLSLLTAPACVSSATDPDEAQTGPLMVVLHRYIASFVGCIPVMQLRQKLAIPAPAEPASPRRDRPPGLSRPKTIDDQPDPEVAVDIEPDRPEDASSEDR